MHTPLRPHSFIQLKEKLGYIQKLRSLYAPWDMRCKRFHNNFHQHSETVLKVQIVSPVEQIDHDKGERKRNTRVVVYVMWILHMTAVHRAEDLSYEGQVSDAAVKRILQGLRAPRLWVRRSLCHEIRLSARGRCRCRGGRILAALCSVGIAGNGGDNAIDLLLTVLHVLGYSKRVKERDGEKERKWDGQQDGQNVCLQIVMLLKLNVILN